MIVRRYPSVAIVHDYLTQRGGAERVVLAMLKAFPGAPLYTSLYAPETTFREFGEMDVRTLPVNRLRPLRGRHRLALGLLAASFSGLTVRADVVLCSSSGWAHGVRTLGRKFVYCHSPARWLYQSGRYMRGASLASKAVLAALRRPLIRWDRRAAASADHYLTQCTTMQERIRRTYGIEARLLPPPPGITDSGRRVRPLPGLEPGFFLCVSRLLPYKNLDAVVSAFGLVPERLVIAGDGPCGARLRRLAHRNVTFLPRVSDAELRWLYAACDGLVAASHEDFGLTPLEAGTFGKPVLALRWGGYLDTVVQDVTGFFFDTPAAPAIANAVTRMRGTALAPDRIRGHAASFSERRFIERLQAAVLGGTLEIPLDSSGPVRVPV